MVSEYFSLKNQCNFDAQKVQCLDRINERMAQNCIALTNDLNGLKLIRNKVDFECKAMEAIMKML